MRIRTLLALFPAALAAAAALTLAAGSLPAEAAFPGLNGKVAYMADGIIYSIYPDGVQRTQLTSSGSDSPAWSPDGQKIAFDRGREIYVMNADGSGTGLRNLTNQPAYDFEPTWSPDGQKIAFESNYDIFAMNADGSGQTNLTGVPGTDLEPAWSPDGQRIAFTSHRGAGYEIYVMNADGSGQTRLTSDVGPNVHPAWSPDGRKIVFASWRAGNDYEIHVMDADGSGRTNLTNDPATDGDPAWSPDGQKIAFSRHLPGDKWQIYVMNADGSGAAPVPGAFGRDADWQRVFALPPLRPEPRTAFPGSATIEAGTLRSGSAKSLTADDDVYFEVSSTTSGKGSETSWYGRLMKVPNELTSLRLTYTGKNSRSCLQQLELRDFSDKAGSWVVLDTRGVGTTEVRIVLAPPAGQLGRFVSGTSGPGELYFRVRCISPDGDFVASGDLMQIVYELP